MPLKEIKRPLRELKNEFWAIQKEDMIIHGPFSTRLLAEKEIEKSTIIGPGDMFRVDAWHILTTIAEVQLV